MLCLSVFLVCGCQHDAQPPLVNLQQNDQEQLVPDIIISNVNLEKVSVFDAVLFLRRSEEDRGQTSKTYLNRGISPRTVSIKGKLMTYLAVLDEICAQANLEWTATPKMILIIEKEQRNELTTTADGGE